MPDTTPSPPSKSSLKKKTILRKKKKMPVPLPDDKSKELQCVDLYMKGNTIDEISEKFSWLATSVSAAINKHFRSLKQLLETEALVTSQTYDMQINMKCKSPKQMEAFRNQRKIDEDISASFLEKISPPEDDVLTTEEVMFCYLIVHEGNAQKALVDSGLSEGLIKSSETYRRACKLRVLMLKGKKNIIRYISSLQIDYAKEMNIGKDNIQTMILEQISQLKEQNDPKNSPTIAKLLESLGRTVGAFSDKVVIEEVSFDDAMDRMIEMRKEKIREAETKGLPTEVFVYDPSKIG